MKKLILAIVAFSSVSAFSSTELTKPKYVGARFACSSEADGVCQSMGLEKALAGSVRCSNKGIKLLTNCDLYKLNDLAAPEVVEVVKNWIGTPTLFDQIRYGILAFNESIIVKTKDFNGCTKIIKKIKCE